MGSRGIQRLFRRARAEIRRRRREAMIGACNDVVAHLARQIATSAEREAALRMWPGFDGLFDNRQLWPEPLSALFPNRDSNGMYVGTIGGRPRTLPALHHRVELDKEKSDRLMRFWGVAYRDEAGQEVR